MNSPTETIQRCLAAYNRHDAAEFASAWIETGTLRHVATGRMGEGRDQIQAGAEERFHAFPDWHLDLHGLYQCGKHAWLAWTISGTHEGEYLGIPATHRRFEVQGCSHITFAPDGLFASDDVYFDLGAWLGQLGLLPDLAAARSG
jgi:steroid delta-isomerase-like uncharacterized protein